MKKNGNKKLEDASNITNDNNIEDINHNRKQKC